MLLQHNNYEMMASIQPPWQVQRMGEQESHARRSQLCLLEGRLHNKQYIQNNLMDK